MLEVGCGSGEALRRIAARWPVKGVGYDLDLEQIERGRGEAGAEVELIAAGAPPARVNELVVCIARATRSGGFPRPSGSCASEPSAHARAWTLPGGRDTLGFALVLLRRD